jgi:hypothetical protein
MIGNFNLTSPTEPNASRTRGFSWNYFLKLVVEGRRAASATKIN